VFQGRQKRLTIIFPSLLATDEAGSIDRAEIKVVIKNIVPNLLSGRLNLSWKKKVIQELG
jgi:hypothetical protein